MTLNALVSERGLAEGALTAGARVFALRHYDLRATVLSINGHLHSAAGLVCKTVFPGFPCGPEPRQKTIAVRKWSGAGEVGAHEAQAGCVARRTEDLQQRKQHGDRR